MGKPLQRNVCLSNCKRKKKAHLNVISEQNPPKTKYMFAKKNKIIYSKRRLDTRIYCQSAKGSSKRCFGRPFAAKARIESNTFQPPKTQIYRGILTQILPLEWCVRKSKLCWYSTLVDKILKVKVTSVVFWDHWCSNFNVLVKFSRVLCFLIL